MLAPWVSLADAASELNVSEARLWLWISRAGGVTVEHRGGVPGVRDFDLAALLEQEAERRAAFAAHEEDAL